MSKQWLRTNINYGALGVDELIEHSKGHGTIYGVAILTKGKINDGDARDWQFDNVSLEQVVALGNNAKMGIKTRYGHPNMSSDALGTFLGRTHNFRVDGDVVRADLFFDKTAFCTPEGDLAGYVMDLASNDPSAFGTSMVFDAELEYMLEKDGTKQKDKEGKELPALVRFKKLFATDVVDDPAANKGMFSKFITGNVLLSAEMTTFLDKFLTNEDAVNKTIAFLERYRSNKDEDADDKEESMELKDVTIDMLKSDRTDIVEAIKKEATDALSAEMSEKANAEKARVSGILSKAAEYQMFELASKSISDGETIEQAESKMKEAKLAAIKKDAPQAAGPGVDPEAKKPELSLEDKCREEFKNDAKIRDEFAEESTYIAFKKAEAANRVRISSKK